MSETRRSDPGWRRDSAVVAGRSGAAWSSAPAPADADFDTDGESADDVHPFSIAESARYEAVAELGIGGMGRVLTTADRRLRRQVALKEIAKELCEKPGIERRFAREAWITAALDHPAIVPIFDAGRRPDGTLYYTMRLIRGRALSTAIRESAGLTGRLALLRHFLVTCEALAYAHSQGVVHRDLKPEIVRRARAPSVSLRSGPE